MRCSVAIAAAYLCLSAAASPSYAAPDLHPDWSGVWRGALTNLPQRGDASPVDVRMDIGAYPVADNACSMWKTTYTVAGQVKSVKDYRLCRGTGPEDLFIDEGDGIKLAARWIGSALVSPFKYDDRLLVVTTRQDDDRLVEEILSIDDKPAIKGVVTLIPRGIQRLELRRSNSTGG